MVSTGTVHLHLTDLGGSELWNLLLHLRLDLFAAFKGDVGARLARHRLLYLSWNRGALLLRDLPQKTWNKCGGLTSPPNKRK